MRVLIADDEPVSLHLLSHHLEAWGFDICTVRDGDAAWRLLTGPEPPRLAILDWLMPGLNGVELCRRLRAQPTDDYTYIILLTVRGNKHDLVFAMNAGADDYLAKPVDPEELHVRLQAGHRIVRLQQELQEAKRSLLEQVERDALTGIYNRRAILGILSSELAREERDGKPLGLAMADLDYFKQINDTLGHQTGDGVLRSAAECMSASIRPYDSLGRYGGEEFLLVLPGCDQGQAANVAERLRTGVQHSASAAALDRPPITVSLGVTSTDGLADRSAESLIAVADRALYRAKHRGRNRVEVGQTHLDSA